MKQGSNDTKVVLSQKSPKAVITGRFKLKYGKELTSEIINLLTKECGKKYRGFNIKADGVFSYEVNTDGRCDVNKNC